MKRFMQYALLGLLVLALHACNGGGGGDMPAGEAKLETLEDSIVYGMGASNVKSVIEQLGIENPNLAAMYQGMKDAMEGEPVVSDMEFQQMAQAYFTKQQQKKGDDARQVGQDFLDENANKEGVMSTESGLQYKIIEEGTGVSPGPEDKVKVHYTGRLINGKVFDSSVERGEPVTFPVNGVIPGWTEALQLMKEGAKWELYIPSDLAYGPRGAGQDIGPNETLIFEVELLEVNPEM